MRPPSLALLVLALLSASAGAATATEAAKPPTQAAAAQATPAATPFAQMRPGLYAGGQPTAADLTRLQAQGVHTVIDLRAPGEDRGYDEGAAARQLGLAYVALPIAGKDDVNVANAQQLQALLREHGNEGVLLHCASGNRVGALLALGAAHDGMPREQALALGRQAGLKSLEAHVVEQLDAATATP